jgi:hypothetical protein
MYNFIQGDAKVPEVALGAFDADGVRLVFWLIYDFA